MNLCIPHNIFTFACAQRAYASPGVKCTKLRLDQLTKAKGKSHAAAWWRKFSPTGKNQTVDFETHSMYSMYTVNLYGGYKLIYDGCFRK